MRREEQLKFCRSCKNQKFDMKQVIICNLTNKPADFEETCSLYIEDAELKDKLEKREIEKETFNKMAGQGKRFANYLIDLAFFAMFSFIFGAVLGIILAIFFPSALSIFDQDNKLIDYSLGLIAGIIYYAFLEMTTGRTIAKFITKTKVVNEKGDKPNFSTILIRTLCRFIPFEPFSFLGSDNSGWHDKFSKTMVIEIK